MANPQQGPVPSSHPINDSRTAPSNTTNFYGPVNYIERSNNANLGANYGHIHQATYGPFSTSICKEDAELLRPIPDASHTRNLRNSPPNSSCLPGTRTFLIEKMTSWMDGTTSSLPEEHPHFLNRSESGWRALAEATVGDSTRESLSIPTSTHITWLCGPVGCGKSAIAQTLAVAAAGRGRLAGSFFFFRGSGSRSKFGRLAITLANQMAGAIPATKPHVEEALRESPGLYACSVGAQFERLLYRPFQKALADGTTSNSQIRQSSPLASFIFVIDGLDECEDRDDIRDFTIHMTEFFTQNTGIPLRFLITSRIEEHIQEVIDSDHIWVLDLGDHEAEKDIQVLVAHTFHAAAKRNRVIRSYGEGWPHDHDIQLLVEHADGSFIFITTLLNYILGLGTFRSDGLTPMERFNIALTMDPGLDYLYTEILARAQHIPFFQVVVFTVASMEFPLSISDLSRLLDIPSFKVVNVLIPLQSIVRVPGDDDQRITLFHTSFRDFLLSDTRSGAVFPGTWRTEHKEYVAHRLLALRLGIGRNGPLVKPIFFYAQNHWRRHWNAVTLHRSERFIHHFDHLLYLLSQVIPSLHFPHLMGFISAQLQLEDPDLSSTRNFRAVERLFDIAQGAPGSFIPTLLLHAWGLPWNPLAPLSEPESYTLAENTPAGIVLLCAAGVLADYQPRLFLSSLIHHIYKTIPTAPDPSLHRWMVGQFMCHLTGAYDTHLNIGSHETDPILGHESVGCYFLTSWLSHLCLGLDGDPHDVEGFLNNPYPLLHQLSGPYLSMEMAFINSGTLRRGVHRALDRLKDRFPDLKLPLDTGSAGGLVEYLVGAPGIEVRGAVTVADILVVFSTLFPPLTTSSRGPGPVVIRDITNCTLLVFHTRFVTTERGAIRVHMIPPPPCAYTTDYHMTVPQVIARSP